MPTERQIQALNMSPRGISVDDSSVSSTPLLVKDVNTYPNPATVRQPSHFSRVINQNNLDFPVTCTYEFNTGHGGFHYSQAPLDSSTLSRKRSFNQSYNRNTAACPTPRNLNSTYDELTVDIPNTKPETIISSSIPCSPHSWANSQHGNQSHHVFSIDDMGALRGPNSYNFGNNAGANGMARSVSFGADSFPDQQYSMYSSPGYHNVQNKRSSFQGTPNNTNALGCDGFSDSSGFSSMHCQRGQRSPGSDRPMHMDQLNTSQFGSDVSNVESVFSDIASYSQYSENQMDIDSLRSPRDSYGANEELRTSFSSGSQCSETVQRSELFDLLGTPNTQKHTESLEDQRLFYVGGGESIGFNNSSNNVVLSNTWSHMDLALGPHQSNLPATTNGYQTGALNALNLDGNFDDVDFDSILEDMNTFSYRPPVQAEIEHVEPNSILPSSCSSDPVDTTNPAQITPCNNNNSATMARSCSLENILEDINKTATCIGASQNSLFDVLNLDTVTEIHESMVTNCSNTNEQTPKRGQNFQNFASPHCNQSVPGHHVQRSHSHTVIQPHHFESRQSCRQRFTPHQHAVNYTIPPPQTPENVSQTINGSHRSSIDPREFFGNFPNYSGGDVISKSPKHKRWKLSVIDRTSRSPSLEDIPMAFNMPQKLNPPSVYSVPSPLAMNTATPGLCAGPQKPASASGSVSGRRSVRSKTFSNPRMRSASNPSSVIVFSDDDEIIHESSIGGMYVSGGSAANRRCNSDASKRHHYDSIESHHARASHHSLEHHRDRASSGRQSGFSSFNSRSSSCSSSSNPPPQTEKPNSGPPINININVFNLITSDGGENVVPVKLSDVTSNVLSSVVTDQTETATKIAKLFQDKNSSAEPPTGTSAASSTSIPRTPSAPSKPTQHGHIGVPNQSVIADDHDYLRQFVSAFCHIKVDNWLFKIICGCIFRKLLTCIVCRSLVFFPVSINVSF